MNITVLGSGSWGSALAYLLADNSHKVRLWSFRKEEAESIIANKENKEFLPGVPLPENVEVFWDKKEALFNAELVVNAVPSKFVRSTMESFKGLMPEKISIVNVSKGLEDGSLKRLSEVIKEVYPEAAVAVLSGPSHAEEVSRRLPTTVAASSSDLALAEMVQDVFMNKEFRVYTNTDIIGVELGGALKNVIALAAGISDGMGFGDNTKAALMTRGIKEISQLGAAMGAEINTFFGLSGIGDLIVTCTSMHSRNRRAGILLGQGKSLEETLKEIHMVVEGVNTSNAAYELSLRYNVPMPITAEINNVLNHGKSPVLAVEELMTRNKKQEHNSEDTIGGRLIWQ
jgi:glycerol-3-phosphate dehydrogenase (NAD(P)+)